MAGALLGALPGLLITTRVAQIGTAVALLGAAIGAVFGFSRLSPVRVLKLLIVFIIARNLPGTSDRVFESFGSEELADDQSAMDSAALIGWLRAADTGPPRGWLVAVGLLLGAMLGGGLMLADLRSLDAGQPALVLPLPRARDTLTTQALIATAGFTIWGGACAGILASSAYRRMILLAGGVSAFLSSCVALAAAQPREGFLFDLVIFLTTAGLGTALFLAYAFSLETEGIADGDAQH